MTKIALSGIAVLFLAATIYPWMEIDYPPHEKEQPLNITTEEGEIITLTPREVWLNLNDLRKSENKIFIRMLSTQLALTNVDRVVVSDIRPEIEMEWCERREFVTVYIDPVEAIYEPNDFDKQVLPYKERCNHIFVNEFDGYEKIDRFIEEVLGVNAK